MTARVVALTLLALAVLPGTALATQVLAVEQARIHADTWGGRTAWSSFDPEARVWHLATLEDGKVVRTEAPEAAHPFRLDVGPGPDGRPVAVYPRCVEEAECDLFLFDFARGRERKLRGVSTKRASESLPSIWRRRIAFARRAAGVSTLYVARLDGKEAQVVPSGPQRQPAGPLAIELNGTRVAFVWTNLAGDGSTETTLWIRRGDRIRWLDRTTTGPSRTTTFVTPEIRGRHVFYARPATGTGVHNELRRVHVRTRRVRVAPAPFRGIVTAVRLGRRFLLSRALPPRTEDPEGECRPPGSEPEDTVCRLLISNPVTRWRRPSGASR